MWCQMTNVPECRNIIGLKPFGSKCIGTETHQYLSGVKYKRFDDRDKDRWKRSTRKFREDGAEKTTQAYWLEAYFYRIMSRGNDVRVYVGNLPPDIRARDIEDLFYKFGKIAFVDLKTRRGPPFCFVEFEDPR